ncbi:MAG TPA: hypothetical protein VH109_05930 [Steroidobacteraceae bacterium]|nr:hypothetical protein [Steroidobacteraceae bacterium]
MRPAEAPPSVAQLRDSPDWFPLEVLEAGAVRLLKLDEAGYRAASFLDQRLLQGPHEALTLEPAVLTAAAAGLPVSSLYLFHIGHVGSTLLSRLLGEDPGFLALREPALLRALALRPAPESSAAPTPALALDTTLRLLARTFRREQRAVIKATSFVNEIADEILALSGAPPAVFVFAEPLAYLRGIFGGPNSRVETRALSAARLRRLVRRLGATAWPFDPRTEGEQVAMSWLCEMLTLHQAMLARRGRVLWVNFDTFLAEPLRGLEQIFDALGASAPPGELRALLDGPIMHRYAKAPEHAYDASLRRDVLAAADQEHAGEIRRAMRWLEAVTGAHAPVRSLFTFLGTLKSQRASQ